MGILMYLEAFLGWLLSNQKGRDARLFTKGSAFKDHPEPTIEITSPDVGPSNSNLKLEVTPLHSIPFPSPWATDTDQHTQWGTNTFPTLSWTLPPTLTNRVVEYILIAEDADAPIPSPPTHGAYFAIPSSKTRVSNSDFAFLSPDSNELKGGFRLGRNIRGTIYGGPRPVLGHGPHRYFYELVALGEGLGLEGEEGKRKVGVKELGERCVGKVVGWGQWVGVFENTWEGAWHQ